MISKTKQLIRKTERAENIKKIGEVRGMESKNRSVNAENEASLGQKDNKKTSRIRTRNSTLSTAPQSSLMVLKRAASMTLKMTAKAIPPVLASRASKRLKTRQEGGVRLKSKLTLQKSRQI